MNTMLTYRSTETVVTEEVGGVATFPRVAGGTSLRHTTIGGVTYKIADCRSEREAAFRLVYGSYRRSGLIPRNPHCMRVTPYHLKSSTDVFVAVHQGTVIYTVTLISDNDEGFPCEAIFQDEVDAMRTNGLHLAEVSCLAGKENYFEHSQGMQVFVNMIGHMLQYGRHNSIDRLLLAVHPRHGKFYERLFGCQRNSEVKSYEAVQGKPAVLCTHDFEYCETHRYRYYDDVWQLPFQRMELRRQPMSPAERWYFDKAVVSRQREFFAVGA